MATDEELMERSQRGNREAFGELVERYEDLVFSVCYRMLDNVEDARSYTQKTFMKAWEHRDRFDTDRSFKPWICGIATNECSNFLSKASTRREQSGVAEAKLSDDDNNPVKRLEREELKQEIGDALEALNPDYRQLVVMKYVAGLSYSEMAEETGTTESSVESKLHRARGKLKDQLQNLHEDHSP